MTAVHTLTTPDQTYAISVYQHAKGSKHARRLSFTLEQLRDYLADRREVAEKGDLPGWSTATFAGDHRTKSNCQAVTMFGLDVDNADGEIVTVAAARALLDGRGLAYLLHETWSSTPERPKFRIAIPLVRPLPGGDDWKRWVEAAVVALGLAPLRHALDTAAMVDCARLWYLPGTTPGGTMPAIVYQSGEVLDLPIPEKPVKPRARKARRLGRKAPSAGDPKTLDIVGWFTYHGCYRRPLDGGKHAVECPWAGEHTSEGQTDTVIWESGGAGWPTFHCSHSHCVNRKLDDVAALWGDADAYCAQRYDPAKQPPAPLPPRNYVPNPAEVDASGWPRTPAESFRRFVQVAGLDSVYDRHLRRFYRTGEFRGLEGGRIEVPSDTSDRFVTWTFLSAPDRPTICDEQIRFAPGEDLPEPMINLFPGLPYQDSTPVPPGDGVPMLVEILRSCCQHDQATLDYLLDWLAWPLQHVGHKLRSAVIAYGEEGTGKSLVLSRVMRSVYGARCSVAIGQTELDSSFNAWASRMLYVCGEEVMSNEDVKNLSGRLKAMITEPTVQINEKNQRVRVEDNHLNMVFLSNADTPIWLGQHDRRYLVLQTPLTSKLAPEFYTEAARLHEASPAAWYWYLRNRVVGEDFPSRPVPVTEAKRQLQAECSSSAAKFVARWLEGNCEDTEGMVLPVKCVSMAPLAACYQRWCRGHGYKANGAQRLASEMRTRGFELHKGRVANIWAPPSRALAMAEADEMRAACGVWYTERRG